MVMAMVIGSGSGDDGGGITTVVMVVVVVATVAMVVIAWWWFYIRAKGKMLGRMGFFLPRWRAGFLIRPMFDRLAFVSEHSINRRPQQTREKLAHPKMRHVHRLT